ncbi:MAG: hypothetical protein TUN42_02325 [Dehalogenimonas sp.]
MTKKWKITAVVALAITMIAIGGSLVMAQTTPEVTTPGCCEGGGAGLRGFGSNSAVLTDLLGLTSEQLYQLRAEGKTLAQIAATKGVSEDALVAAILAPRQEILKSAVAAGKLTQAQADLMLKRMESNIRLQIKSNEGPRGFGGSCAGFDDDVTAPAAGFGGMRGFGGMHR